MHRLLQIIDWFKPSWVWHSWFDHFHFIFAAFQLSVRFSAFSRPASQNAFRQCVLLLPHFSTDSNHINFKIFTSFWTCCHIFHTPPHAKKPQKQNKIKIAILFQFQIQTIQQKQFSTFPKVHTFRNEILHIHHTFPDFLTHFNHSNVKLFRSFGPFTHYSSHPPPIFPQPFSFRVSSSALTHNFIRNGNLQSKWRHSWTRTLQIHTTNWR